MSVRIQCLSVVALIAWGCATETAEHDEGVLAADGGADDAEGAPSADGGSGGAEGTRSCEGGESYFYLVNHLRVPHADGDAPVPGFDLDGEVSARDDGSGCGHADFVSPLPHEVPGVDNQLAVLAPQLEDFVDVAETMRAAIMEGRLALLVEVSHVDDVVSDDCVTVEVLLGEKSNGAPPHLDEHGRPVAGETYDYEPLRSGVGQIEDGWLRTDPTDLTFTVEAAEPPAPLEIRGAQQLVRISRTELEGGVLGGGLSVPHIVEAIERTEPDMAALAETVLEAHADLGAGCDWISAAIGFDAVEAVKGARRD